MRITESTGNDPDDFERGVMAVSVIRCLDHRFTLPRNLRENNGQGECGECAYQQGRIATRRAGRVQLGLCLTGIGLGLMSSALWLLL